MANTQTVTIVFTDLVGSTALLSRVGEERAEELRREHFGILRDAIGRTGCREVKNLGDGLMIVADSAARGAACAVEIQQAFDRRNRRANEPLTVRVGVSLGDADVEDGDYFGVPVVEASRLCARAEGGEILVADVVRHLSGTRSGLVFEPVGALELKGLEQPVETSRVVWVPVDPIEERPPFPARLEAARSEAFVGRSAESERLAHTWKEVVVDGRLRSTLLAGEPGIGKTTLAARFASDAYEQGAVVLYGRSDEDLGIPYQPWIEALGQLVEGVSDMVVASHVADRGAHLARLVPQLAKRMAVEVPASQDPDSERYVLFGCVADLLARASVEHPVLVVLDDLHWADRPSLQLLRHLHAAETPMRVCILGTFRDSDVAAGDPLSDLLAALHREGDAERIALSGLSDLDLLALLESVAGHDMDEEGVALRDALLGETAGNPFFVGEMVRHLVETRVIYRRDDGRWVASADLRAVGLPVSVREVVGRRLARLGPDTERVLALASVIGRDFDLALLAAVAHMDEDSLIDLCDAAVANRVLQATDRADRYTFAHALIEHTLYGSLSPSRRARAHRAIAEELEAVGCGDGERVGELAYHWTQAVQPMDQDKAIHYSEAAGQRALAQLAPDEALRWFEQALELFGRTPSGDARMCVQLQIGLGEAQRQCGIAGYRDTLLDASRTADSIDAIDLLVRAVLANYRGIWSAIGYPDEERIMMIDRALERLPADATAEQAQLLGLACVERTWSTDGLTDRLALADQAIDAARRSGDMEVLALNLTQTCELINSPPTAELRATRNREACEIADGIGSGATRYWAHAYALWTALEGADHDGLSRHSEVVDNEADRVPHATIQWHRMFNLVWRAILQGDLHEAERLAEAALTYGSETGQPDAFGIYGAQLVNIRYLQGRLHELVPLIEQAVANSPGLPVYRAVLTYAMACSGETEEAARMLDADLDSGFPMRVDGNWLVAFAYWTDAATRLEHVGAAAAIHDQLVPYHALVPTSRATVRPSVAHHLGLLNHILGRFDEAERWYSEAMSMHRRLASPLLVAATQATWALTLAERNLGDDRVHANQMAQEALAAATTGGYGLVEADARRSLMLLS